MYQATLARLHSRIRTIVETDCPELLPLMGSDIGSTKQNFSEAGRLKTLRELGGRCDSEIEHLVGIAFLGMAAQTLKGTTK